MLETPSRFDWFPVGTLDGRSDVYPRSSVRSGRREGSQLAFSGPAVYRWVLEGASGERQFLVGQTDNLCERHKSYLNSGGLRHVLIRSLFNCHLGAGGRITLEILQFEPFTVYGVVFCSEALTDTFVRSGLEAVCAARFAKEGTLLQVGVKALRSALARLQTKGTPEVHSERRQIN